MQAKAIRGAIFDVDGTLVDSNDAHARAWVRALTEHGATAELGEVRRLIGMGGDKLIERITGLDPESPRANAMTAARARIFTTEHLHLLRAFPGTRQLFQRLRAAGFRIAIASSARAGELKPLLELASVEDLVEQVTSSDDASRSKPDPDIVGAALERLELEPAEAVMVGDTPYDIEAASHLGISTIALRSGGWADAELSGAIAVYDDVAQLLEQLSDTPFRNASTPQR